MKINSCMNFCSSKTIYVDFSITPKYVGCSKSFLSLQGRSGRIMSDMMNYSDRVLGFYHESFPASVRYVLYVLRDGKSIKLECAD